MEQARITPVVRYYGSDVATADPAAVVERELDVLTELELDLPRERRPSGATLAALAALAGVLAIGLGSWAFLSALAEPEATVTVAAPAPTAPPSPPAAPSGARAALSLLATPSTERIRLRGSVGRITLVIGRKDDAALVLNGLGPAPAGRAYQAWVIRPGARSVARGAVFDGRRALVPLKRRVPVGATVAVTLERAGGAQALTRTPRLVAQRS